MHYSAAQYHLTISQNHGNVCKTTTTSSTFGYTFYFRICGEKLFLERGSFFPEQDNEMDGRQGSSIQDWE